MPDPDPTPAAPAPSISNPISVDKTLLQQYGLPTALLFSILGPLFGAFIWLVRGDLADARLQRDRQVAALTNSIDDLDNSIGVLTRIVDLSCQPAKPKIPPP